jgi:hypothetical protein
MMGVDHKPEIVDGKIQPLLGHGVKLMSLGFIVERDAPAIWRGPIIMKIIQQFLRDVEWGELDYFLVDLPPGTGDAQLSLAQSIQLRAALIVTTPRERSAILRTDVRRWAFDGYRRGMSGFVPALRRAHRAFSRAVASGWRRAGAADGQVPLQAGMPNLADVGHRSRASRIARRRALARSPPAALKQQRAAHPVCPRPGTAHRLRRQPRVPQEESSLSPACGT